ncbi:MAG TPA: alpha/beta fold hydrolase [Thermoleophilaceae bacterium]|nr:alpha/beta fold hydrolase [Thermoleophilaceae bacterium]
METRYTRSGDVHIAYQAMGHGPALLYVPTWVSQMEQLGSEPRMATFIERLCSFARLITFDRRGSGLSDPVEGAPTLEEQIDDILAVMEAVGTERTALVASLEGGPLAITFAASHPDKVSSLILYATFARTRWAEDYDFPPRDHERGTRLDRVIAQWGQGAIPRALAPSRAGDPAFADWAGRMERYSASPGTIRKMFDTIAATDVRHVLPTLSVPTLVMHRRDDAFLMVEHSRYLAEHIPGARYVELEGTDSLFSEGDSEAILGEIEEELTGSRHAPEPDRVLATVMFTDIVDSTRHAAGMGDARWRELLARQERLTRAEVERHRGRTIKSTGDGVLATFDGPARAIRAAQAVRDGSSGLGLEVRAGLHTGECELVGDDVAGLAVHIGARVMGLAGAGEVLTSSTVKDLVAGSGIDFGERGEHELRDVPGRWRLFSVGR